MNRHCDGRHLLMYGVAGSISRRGCCMGYARFLSVPLSHYNAISGIAYTIDPVYESEVRDYLGTWDMCTAQN